MDAILDIIRWIVDHGPELISVLVAVFTAAVAVALLIPGDQPEKTLQAILDFIKKFSRKPTVLK